MDKGLGQSHTLAVAFGELADALVAFGGEPHKLDHLLHLLFGLLDAIYTGGKAEELAHIHVGIERVVLGQVARHPAHGQRVVVDAVAADGGFAFGGRDVAREDFHQG